MTKATQEQQSTIALATKLHFAGQKEGSNLAVSMSLTLPASEKELDSFLKDAKKHVGKEVEIAPSLVVEFVRGGDTKAKIVGNRRSTLYESVEDAINDYFNIPDDETLVYEEEAEDAEGDTDTE